MTNEISYPVIGAVIAGGRSSRFGSDKAVAEIDGRPIIQHVLDALTPQVAAIVICGRTWGTLSRLDDLPCSGLGPLAGLNAALRHAEHHGFDGVLSAPVDVLPLPLNLMDIFTSSGPAVLDSQHLIGWWPTILSNQLDQEIRDGMRCVGEWITLSGARRVRADRILYNLNYPEDIHGLRSNRQ